MARVTTLNSSTSASFFSLDSENPYLVRFGTCFDIPIDVHPTFFALLALSAVSAVSGGAVYVALVCILYGPVLLFTIVTHELGHALTTKHLGASVRGIILWPLGGLALCGATGDPWHDLKVAVAGPAMHVPMAFLWWAVLAATKSGDGWLFGSAIAFNAIIMNVYLFCFNLFLPAYPLDGGRVLAAALIIREWEPNRAAATISGIAGVLASALIAWGVYSVIAVGEPNAVMSIGVGLWILGSSKNLWDSSQAGTASAHPLFFASQPPPSVATNRGSRGGRWAGGVRVAGGSSGPAGEGSNFGNSSWGRWWGSADSTDKHGGELDNAPLTSGDV